MRSEIIQSVAYDNYDDFQHVNLHIFTQKNHFLKTKKLILIMMKLTLG
jgi:hypothetical protein